MIAGQDLRFLPLQGGKQNAKFAHHGHQQYFAYHAIPLRTDSQDVVGTGITGILSMSELLSERQIVPPWPQT